MNRRTGTALAAAAVALILGGCSAGSNSGGATSGTAGMAADNGSSVGSSVGSGAEAVTGKDAVPPLQQFDVGKDEIKTADITVRSDDVNGAADRATGLVVASGGQVDGDTRSGDRQSRVADLVLRVPPNTLDETLGRLGGLGQELNRSVSTQDVSTVVADVDARVSTLSASISRLQALSAQAANVTDLVNLERELTTREADLESLQAQQRALSDQVALATISLHLVAQGAPDAADTPGGFLSGLGSGWDAFLIAGATLLTAFGVLLPFVITAVVIIAGVLVLRRRRRTPTVATDG